MVLGRPMPPLVLSDDEVRQLQALASSRSLLHSIVQRAQALLAALRTVPEAPEAASTAPALAAAPADPQTQAEWADIRARLVRLEAEAHRRQAETTTAREALAKLQATLPLARQRVTDVAALAAQGFIAGHAGQDRTRERIEQERDLATQQARVAEAEAAWAESRRTRSALLAETRRSLSDWLTKATQDLAQLQQQSAKAVHRQQITQLKSPVAGTVQQLAVRTTGGVVTAAQPLMVVVPDEAEITAEVSIDNKDIGFVRVGQEAAVKLEAFNFTRYGTVPAVVSRVSADAVADENKGTVFVAGVKLARNAIGVDGTLVPLTPGMNLTAEVRTGSRAVIEFVLSPIQRQVGESGRER